MAKDTADATAAHSQMGWYAARKRVSRADIGTEQGASSSPPPEVCLNEGARWAVVFLVVPNCFRWRIFTKIGPFSGVVRKKIYID